MASQPNLPRELVRDTRLRKAHQAYRAEFAKWRIDHRSDVVVVHNLKLDEPTIFKQITATPAGGLMYDFSNSEAAETFRHLMALRAALEAAR